MNIGPQIPHVYEFGPFKLDASERTLSRDGEAVKLTPKLIDTLLVLVSRNNHIVEKDQLMEAVWPGTFVEESNLSSNVSLLRKALGLAADGEPYIETIPTRGYRFAAEVTERTDAAATVIVRRRTTARMVTSEEIENLPGVISPAPLELTAGQSIAVPDTQAIAAKSTARRAFRKVAFLSVLVLLLVGSVLSVWLLRRAKSPAKASEVRTVAILPFKEISPQNNSERYLGLGMADALITKLGNLKHVIVRPTSAVRKYADAGGDSLAAGRELGVEAVLEGNIQHEGDRIHVTVRLLRVGDGAAFWSETIEDKFIDIFAVQDSISEKIVKSLRVSLSDQDQLQLQKRYTGNPQAYEAYLKGRYFWNKRNADGFKKAIDFFKQATDIDPNYALAYVGLADCYNLLPSYVGLPAGDFFPQARAAATEALRLDDTLAEGHASLGWVKLNFDWDWPETEKEFRRALDLNPNYATAHHWYGIYLGRMGRFEESVSEFNRAQELDPLSLAIGNSIGLAYFQARQYDQSEKQFQKQLEFDPKYVPAHFHLRRVYLQKRMYEKATAEALTLMEQAPSLTLSRVALAQTYAAAGKQDEARKALNELIEVAKREYVGPYGLAIIYASLGDKERAFASLEKAFAVRDVNLTLLRVDPEMDSLRPDPRFTELLHRIGLAS